MIRVLFVDDEPNVLKGLERMLRAMRREWEMHFASSGREALAKLGDGPIDVVVTDMRMPEMDGAELLAIVRQRFPRVVRIIFSGHSDRQMILRAVSSTHQFLTKPCDAETLKEAITRSCALHKLLASDALREIFIRLDTLPCLHEVYNRLIEQLHDPDASLEQIGRTISQDIAISAKMLQLVNTPFFGICHHVSSPAQAATLLGIDIIKALVLTAGLFSNNLDGAVDPAVQREFQMHSLMVGALARQIAADVSSDSILVDHAFMGGMLHDLGKLIIAVNLPQISGETDNLARSEKIPIWRVEKEWLGASHAEIGACLLALWGLPDPVVESIAYHHVPSRHPCRSFTPLTAVHVADALFYEIAGDAVGILGPLDTPYLEALGLVDRLPRWRNLCEQHFAKIDRDPAALVEEQLAPAPTFSGRTPPEL